MNPAFLDRKLAFFDRLERLQAAPLQLVGVLVSVLFVRIILEWVLESQKTIESPAALLLFLLYFSSVLGGIFLILWAFSGKSPAVVLKAVAFFSPILLIPPILDFVVSGGKGFTLLFVFSPPPFLTALSNACTDCAGVSPGLRVEVLLTMLAAGSFILWATRSGLKAGLVALALYVFVVFQALWPAYILGYLHHPYTDVYFTRELLSSYALLVCAAFLIPWHAATSPKRRRVRWIRVLHYAGLGLFGAFLGLGVWDHPWPGVLLPLAAILTSIVLAFGTAVRINDWADNNALRKSAPSAFPMAEVLAFSLLSAVAGWAVGYPAWMLVALALALSVAYSVPPIRLRRHVVPASVILAACSIAVVAAGFSVGLLDQGKVPELLPPRIILLVFGFIFLAAPFKDLKDAVSDRKSGTFTLATWLPEKTARRVSAFLVAAAVLWATWLSGIPWLIGLAFAIAAAWCVASIQDLERMEHVVFALDYTFLALLALHLSGFWLLA